MSRSVQRSHCKHSCWMCDPGKHWPGRGKDTEAWVVDSTKKDGELTVRNIRFWCQGRKFGGFTVTSKGAEICGVAPLV